MNINHSHSMYNHVEKKSPLIITVNDHYLINMKPHALCLSLLLSIGDKTAWHTLLLHDATQFIT